MEGYFVIKNGINYYCETGKKQNGLEYEWLNSVSKAKVFASPEDDELLSKTLQFVLGRGDRNACIEQRNVSYVINRDEEEV